MIEVKIRTKTIPATPRSKNYPMGATVFNGGGSKDIDISSKLDSSIFYDYFSKVNVGSEEKPHYAIKSNYDFFSGGEISAGGLGTSDSGASGATALYQLVDISKNAIGDGVLGAAKGKVLTYDGTHWYAGDAGGLDETTLKKYLTDNKYATQSWIEDKGYITKSVMNAALANKVDAIAGKGLSTNDFTSALLNKLNGIAEGANKYILPVAKAAILGGVMIGSTLTASAEGILNLSSVGKAGTYTKVATDSYGRVINGYSLSASDIPALDISKITGLQTALDKKLDKATFESFFAKDENGNIYVVNGVNFYTNGEISAGGVASGDGGGGSASALYQLLDVTPNATGDGVLGAVKGNVLTYDGTHWYAAKAGMNETALQKYLTDNNYAKHGEISFGSLTGKPTTLAGYGITDAMSLTTADGRYIKKTGDTMTGWLRVKVNSAGSGIMTEDGVGLLMYEGETQTEIGMTRGITYIRSGAQDLRHNKGGTQYLILDTSNYKTYAVTREGNPQTNANDWNGVGILPIPQDVNASAANNFPVQQAGSLFYCTAAYGSSNQIYGTYSSNRWFVRGGGKSSSEKTVWAELVKADGATWNISISGSTSWHKVTNTITANNEFNFVASSFVGGILHINYKAIDTANISTGLITGYQFDDGRKGAANVRLYAAAGFATTTGFTSAVTSGIFGHGYIQLTNSTPYIDFRFGNGATGITSRIVESSSGTLQFTKNVLVSGDTYFGSSSNWINAIGYAMLNHVVVKGSGNTYVTGGLEVRGNGTTSAYPLIGFHQPNIQGSCLFTNNSGGFEFKNSDLTSYRDISVRNIYADGTITPTGRIYANGGIRATIGGAEDWGGSAVFACADTYPLVFHVRKGTANTRRYYFSGDTNRINLSSATDNSVYTASIASFYHNGDTTLHGTLVVGKASRFNSSLNVVGSLDAGGTIKSTSYLGFHNQVGTGTYSFLRLQSGTILWDLAVKDTENSGAFQLRKGGQPTYIFEEGRLIYHSNNAADLGSTSLRWKKIWALDADISGTITVTALNAQRIGVTNTSSNTGYGISLYGGNNQGMPTYGLAFAGTGTFGKHGEVQGDWATYFTMDNTANRGWIFKRGSTNVVSVDGYGNIAYNGWVRNMSANQGMYSPTGDARWYYSTARSGWYADKQILTSSSFNIFDKTLGAAMFTTAPDADRFVCKKIGANGSFAYEVILLIPAVTVTNESGANKIQGRFIFCTNGANQYGYADVMVQCNYNSVLSSIEGGNTRTNTPFVLATCTYNGVKYICMKVPYAANRWDQIYFYGTTYSQFAGGYPSNGTKMTALPVAIKYKTAANGSNAEVINNAEINNSLNDNLAVSPITSHSNIQQFVQHQVAPYMNNSYDMGAAAYRWRYVYGVNGNFNGTVQATDGLITYGNLSVSGTSGFGGTSTFTGRATFNGGVNVGYSHLSYQLSVNSFISNDWVRTNGATGWYSQTYGGGVFMSDNTYVRIYGGKRFFVPNAESTDFSHNCAISTDGGIHASKNITTEGYIAAKGEVSAGATSDRRLKKNFSNEDYQQRVLDLGLVKDFEYKEKEMKRGVRPFRPGRHTSLIAQDIHSCLSMVNKEKDGYLSINNLDPDFMFTVVGAVQLNVLGLRLVKSEVQTLKDEIKTLKGKIKELECRL